MHFISTDHSKRDISDEFRVTLKLHYCVYPRLLAPIGWLMHWLNVKYNIAFRYIHDDAKKILKPLTLRSLYKHSLGCR